ncbi:MAG: AAA family ATPase [Devosia sp.]
MRILRLELLRYGRFTDRVLNFRQNAGLHLVYGPNEAGKSSSLAAIGDLLFGFGKRTDFDFMHEASTLRVGAEIVSRGGGETLRFRRRRGNKNTLLSDSDDETPLQEDALVPYLGTLNREVFSRAFGLNSTTLREGGAAMLESEGEMGSALFAAASGLTGFARLRRNLEAEADAIFAPRPSKERRFYQLLERHEAAVAEERQREVKSGDWRDLSAEIESIERQLAEIKARRLEVTTALGRLQRLKVLEPIISAVDTLEATLKGFEDLPEVPEGFVAECRAALEAAEGAQLQERMAAEDVEVATAALDSIVVDEVFLQNADRIVELFSRRGEYLSRSAEIPRLELECDEVSQRLGELAQRLGARDADELIRRLPPEAVLESAPAIIDEGVKLEAAIVADERRLADERGAIEEQLASEAVAGLADPKPWRDRLAALEPDLKRLNEQSYLETS